MRKVKIVFLNHETMERFEIINDCDFNYWHSRIHKQFFDEVTGVVFTPLIVEDLGYTDDQKLQMLREEEISRYKSS